MGSDGGSDVQQPLLHEDGDQSQASACQQQQRQQGGSSSKGGNTTGKRNGKKSRNTTQSGPRETAEKSLSREIQGQAHAARKTISNFAASYRVSDETLSQIGGDQRPPSPDELEGHGDGGATVVSLSNVVHAPVQTLRAAVTHHPEEENPSNPAGDTVRKEALEHMEPHQRRVLTSTTAAAKRARRSRIARRSQYIAAAVMTALLAAGSAVVYLVDSMDGKQTMVAGVPLFAWFIAAALIFPVIAIAVLLVGAAAFVVERALARVFNNAEFVLVGLRTGSQILVAALTFNSAIDILIARTGGGSSPTDAPTAAVAVLQKGTICMVIFAAVELLRNFAARLVSLRVHSGERLQALENTFEKERILHKLMTAVGGREMRERVQAIAKARNIPEAAVLPYLADTYKLSLPPETSGTETLNQRMSAMIKQFEELPEADLDMHAAHAAEFFWWMMREDVDRQDVRFDDIASKLDEHDAAKFAFGLFDLDGDGYVIEPEVQGRFHKIYMERRNVAITLANTEAVIASLSALIGVACHLGAFFAYLAIFGVDVQQLVISLSSMTLALTFVFGHSLQVIYESVVFLFVVRPFQVGDTIVYQDAHHKVSSFGLLWTHLRHDNGTRMAVSNEVLMQANIANLTISEPAFVRLYIDVQSEGITQEIVQDLPSMVQDMMEQQGLRHLFDNEYQPHAAIKSTGGDPLRFQIALAYQLEHNAEIIERTEAAETHVAEVIAEWAKKHDVKH